MKIYLRSIIVIAIVTASCILLVQALSLFVVYNFLTADVYISIIALAFLIAGYLINHKRSTEELRKNKPDMNLLTNRERDILNYLTEGKTNKEIASTLGIELSTVKTHINNLYAKIKVSSRKEVRAKYQARTYQNQP